MKEKTCEQLSINNLVIEVTRRCNMKCYHCLRGEPQNIDIDHKYLHSLFEQIDYVSSITFTGGEPSLVPQIIDDILTMAKMYKVKIGSFYIATNGLDISEAFVIACLKWYAYCSDNEITRIDISNDYYHAEQDNYNTELLDGLSFAGRKYEKECDTYKLIREGRASDDKDARPTTVDQMEIEIWDDSIQIIECEIYLNVLGDIVLGCDWSYEHQTDQTLCSVDDFSSTIKEQYGPDYE